MDGRFMNRPYKWSEVPAPFQRLPTHIRFKITIRPWRIISRFPQGKHITFSKKIYHVCHAHISLCRRHLAPALRWKNTAPAATGVRTRLIINMIRFAEQIYRTSSLLPLTSYLFSYSPTRLHANEKPTQIFNLSLGPFLPFFPSVPAIFSASVYYT